YYGVNVPKIYGPDKGLPYIRPKGKEFDEEKITLAEKKPEATAEDWLTKHNREADFEVWRTKLGAIEYYWREGFFQRPILASEKDWLENLMGGQEKIKESALRDAMILARAAAENEAVDKAKRDEGEEAPW